MNERQTLDELMRSFKFHKNPILNWIYSEFNYFSHTYLNVKWGVKNKLQNLIRGYSDSDCWNLPQATAKFMLPRIKHLRKDFKSLSNRHHLIVNGEVVAYNPNQNNLEYNEEKKDFIDKSNGMLIALSKEEYENVLDEIIFALEFLLLEDDPEGQIDKLYEVYPLNYDPIRDRKMFLTKREGGDYLVEFESKDNIQPDYSKLNKAFERQRNGFLLLGLYFKDLWD
ncbi:hypothetical protein EBU71_15100 [bacterium]|nr:hypothetical protein [Candidatus Elulimicrobium humile]